VKLACKVDGKAALIVGYSAGKKGRVMAVVITEGVMRAVKLRQVVLDQDKLPEELLSPKIFRYEAKVAS
jgi:hypothetical protein